MIYIISIWSQFIMSNYNLVTNFLLPSYLLNEFGYNGDIKWSEHLFNSAALRKQSYSNCAHVTDY